MYRVAHKFCYIYKEPYFRQISLFIPKTFTKHVLNPTNMLEIVTILYTLLSFELLPSTCQERPQLRHATFPKGILAHSFSNDSFKDLILL